MGDKTGIQWTDATWDPIRGCSIVPELLDQPLRWRRPRRIFVNSMSDLFHEDVPDDFIDQVFAVMAIAERHVFQVLTKRPERMRDYVATPGRAGAVSAETGRGPDGDRSWPFVPPDDLAEWWPLPNVWLGTSVEDQETADERIPHLLNTPAAVRWLSCEPLLGPLALERLDRHWLGPASQTRGMNDGIDWIVVGGESGPGARPMHPDWARSIRDQCLDAGVPFFFKQWGAWNVADVVPFGDLGGEFRRGSVRIVKPVGKNDGHFRRGDALMRRVGKKAAGRELDGREWNEYPGEVPV